MTRFDDYPIHPTANPIAWPLSGDPNHYDRYWFNGQDRDGRFFIAAAMGHYPVRDVVDAAFSVVVDGVESSVFASGRMPKDRTTAVGPISVDVVEPLREIRFVADRNATGLGCDLTFRAKTAAVEEPRQTRFRADGALATDHTRFTQWGTWAGTVWLDGTTIDVDPATTVATRDRSWGFRPVGAPTPTNRPVERPRAFWLWAPLHFDGFCTHMLLHEHADGRRWLETAMLVPAAPVAPAAAVAAGAWPPGEPVEWSELGYDIEWEPGRRELRRAELSATDAAGGRQTIVVEKLFSFRMRGIGYLHPTWGHGSAHGVLEVGREDLVLDELDPLDLSSLHVQNVVRARLGDHVGVGVVEQLVLGPHEPTGITGFLDGWGASD